MATKKTAKTQEPTQQNGDNGSDVMVSIGGLWVNTSKAGEMYLAGYFGSAKLYIFKNKSKKKDSHPDYYMTVAPNIPTKSNGASDFEKSVAKDDFSKSDDDPFEDLK